MSVEFKEDVTNIEAEAATPTEETSSVGSVNAEEGEPRFIVYEEALEAILFAAGHPISYATLARVFNITPTEVRDIVANYAIKYNNSELPRGVLLLTYSDSCQLCTKQHYLAEIREALGIKKSGTLSTAALETLAIVAYNQPVTRLFVDTLRKVDSSYAMNSLIDRGLIECKGRLDVPGRPMLYGTTSDFLRSFGLENLDSLPETTEEMMAAFANARPEEKEDASQAGIMETLIEDGGSAAPTPAEESSGNQEELLEASNENEIEEPSAEDDIIADF